MDADMWELKKYGQFTKEWQWFENRLQQLQLTTGESTNTVKAQM